MFKLTLGKTKYQIRILYKSGQDQLVWAYNFHCNSNSQAIEDVTYTTVYPTSMPIFLGLDDIEAVWQVDYRKSVWSFFTS
jgi:hypothetical protein